MSFQNSLKIGQIGETLYFAANAGKLERLDGRAADFRDLVTGDLYEIKLDSYKLEKTPNLFIERYSDKDKQTPGGVWQSIKNGCKYFVYMYVSDLTIFTFETAELVKRIEEIAPKLKTSFVKNATWTTQGYLVPRTMVEDLATVQTLEIKIKESK